MCQHFLRDTQHYPKATPGAGVPGDRAGPHPDGVTVEAHSCRGSGINASASLEACCAQSAKVFVLLGLQIFGSGVLHPSKSNISVIFPSPCLLWSIFDVFGQENIELKEQQGQSWLFLCFRVLSCFWWALWHSRTVPALFPVPLIIHTPCSLSFWLPVTFPSLPSPLSLDVHGPNSSLLSSQVFRDLLPCSSFPFSSYLTF